MKLTEMDIAVYTCTHSITGQVLAKHMKGAANAALGERQARVSSQSPEGVQLEPGLGRRKDVDFLSHSLVLILTLPLLSGDLN